MSKRKRNKIKKRKITKHFDSQVQDAIKNKKIKTNIDFDKSNCNSIKSAIVSGNTSTRFTKGKMLTLAKVSLKSFV